jgi:hypothetical protein
MSFKKMFVFISDFIFRRGAFFSDRNLENLWTPRRDVDGIVHERRTYAEDHAKYHAKYRKEVKKLVYLQNNLTVDCFLCKKFNKKVPSSYKHLCAIEGRCPGIDLCLEEKKELLLAEQTCRHDIMKINTQYGLIKLKGLIQRI